MSTVAQKRAIALGIQVKFVLSGTTTNLTEGYYFKTITKGPITVEQADITHLMSTSDFREFMSLLQDPGDATLTAFYDPEKPIPDIERTPDTMRDMAADGTLTLFYREGSNMVPFFQCDANVQEYGGFSADTGTMIMGDWKFKLSGKPVGGDNIT